MLSSRYFPVRVVDFVSAEDAPGAVRSIDSRGVEFRAVVLGRWRIADRGESRWLTVKSVLPTSSAERGESYRAVRSHPYGGAVILRWVPSRQGERTLLRGRQIPVAPVYRRTLGLFCLMWAVFSNFQRLLDRQRNLILGIKLKPTGPTVPDEGQLPHSRMIADDAIPVFSFAGTEPFGIFRLNIVDAKFILFTEPHHPSKFETL